MQHYTSCCTIQRSMRFSSAANHKLAKSKREHRILSSKQTRPRSAQRQTRRTRLYLFAHRHHSQSSPRLRRMANRTPSGSRNARGRSLWFSAIACVGGDAGSLALACHPAFRRVACARARHQRTKRNNCQSRTGHSRSTLAKRFPRSCLAQR